LEPWEDILAFFSPSPFERLERFEPRSLNDLNHMNGA
jgi:hypothetical protein